MSSTTPQQQTQQLQQCIQQCTNLVNDLQNLTQQSNNNIEMQSSLKEAIHHLEVSIHECSFASKATV